MATVVGYQILLCDPTKVVLAPLPDNLQKHSQAKEIQSPVVVFQWTRDDKIILSPILAADLQITWLSIVCPVGVHSLCVAGRNIWVVLNSDHTLCTNLVYSSRNT